MARKIFAASTISSGVTVEESVRASADPSAILRRARLHIATSVVQGVGKSELRREVVRLLLERCPVFGLGVSKVLFLTKSLCSCQMPFVRLAQKLLRCVQLNQSRSRTMQLEVGKGQTEVSFSIIRLQL